MWIRADLRNTMTIRRISDADVVKGVSMALRTREGLGRCDRRGFEEFDGFRMGHPLPGRGVLGQLLAQFT